MKRNSIFKISLMSSLSMFLVLLLFCAKEPELNPPININLTQFIKSDKGSIHVKIFNVNTLTVTNITKQYLDNADGIGIYYVNIKSPIDCRDYAEMLQKKRFIKIKNEGGISLRYKFNFNVGKKIITTVYADKFGHIEFYGSEDVYAPIDKYWLQDFWKDVMKQLVISKSGT